MKHINVKRLSACLLICVLLSAAALCVHAQDGRTLTGTVVMNGRTDEAVTVVLAAAATGEEVGRTTLDYPDADFTFTGIPAGDYELLASAPGFRPVRQAVTVADTDADVTLTLCLFGDVNGDGRLSTVDAAKVNAFVQGKAALTTYQAACVDVLGTDGMVTNVDAACINSIVRGVFDPTPDACIHSYTILLPAVEPTCTTPGFTAGEKCRLCGLALTAQEMIPATGHTETVLPAIAPTCTGIGVTEGKECSVCGMTTVPQRFVPATGHTAVTVPGIEATCTTAGVTEGSQCSVCGMTLTVQTTIAPFGHTIVDRICTVCGETEGSDGLAYFPLDDGTYAVECGNAKYLSNIVIPATHNGKAVTVIGTAGFSGCANLKSIVIPDSVTSIGGYAFCNCTGLTSITIPDSVTSIGSSAFSGCSNLTIYCEAAAKSSGWNSYWNNSGRPVVWNWRMSEGLDFTSSGDGTCTVSGIGTCTDTDVIILPYTLNGEIVTGIGNHAFSGCSDLTSIAIPQSVTSIGDHAFDGCTGLTKVIIPNRVTDIGEYAFYGCEDLTIIYRDSSIPSGWNPLWNASDCPVRTAPAIIASDFADACLVCLSTDEVDTWLDGNYQTPAFSPGQYSSWNHIATIEKGAADQLRVWGWIGCSQALDMNGFGFAIDNSTHWVCDPAFAFTTEDPVYNASIRLGGIIEGTSRFRIWIDVADLEVGEYTVQAFYTLADGTCVEITGFTLVVTDPVEEPK